MFGSHIRKHFFALSFTLLTLPLLLWGSSGSLAQPDSPDDPIVIVRESIPPYPTTVFDHTSAPSSVAGTLRTFPAAGDAEIREGYPTTNYGIASTFGAGYDNYSTPNLRKRALIRFDTTTYLPPGTTIHSATLRLYMSGLCDAYPTSYQTYQITEDWFEMTVNWANQPAFSTSYGSRTLPNTAAWGYYDFDVTALVVEWVAGDSPEYGIMLRGPESPPYTCAYRDFLSKGGGGFTAGPELVVDYTLPPSTLSVSQNSVQVLHQCGAGNPAPNPVIVTLDSNDAALHDWSTTVDTVSWLQLDETSGKVSRIFSDQIALSFTETATCPATYTTQIQVNAAGLSNGSQTIDVTFQQTPDLYWTYLPLISKPGAVLSGVNTAVSQTATTYDRVILLIGVADYEFMNPPATFTILRPGAPGFDLSNTDDDVYAMRSPFDVSTPGFTGLQNLNAFQTGSVSTTIYYLTEEQATIENIDYALAKIDAIEDANTEVIIYFTGHGGPIPDLSPLDEADGYDEILGPYDLDTVIGPPYFSSPILDDTFATQLGELETEHLAVIMDACNSGGMEVNNANRAVLAASQEDQSSWESSELEHGVFTYYMLEAMIDPTNDTNGDGWISVQEVYDYAAFRVAQYIDQHTDSQQTLFLDLTQDVRLVPVNALLPGSSDQ